MADAPQKGLPEGGPSLKACYEAALRQAKAVLPFRPLLALEAAENALATLEDKILKGWRPRDPLAWVRGAARIHALHLASRRKKRLLSLEEVAPDRKAGLLPPSDLRLSTPPEWKEALLEIQVELLPGASPFQAGGLSTPRGRVGKREPDPPVLHLPGNQIDA